MAAQFAVQLVGDVRDCPTTSQPAITLGIAIRNSNASAVPVDAPDGTEAEALTPPSRTQTAITVGLPRLSRISRPKSFSIFGMGLKLSNEFCDHVVDPIWKVIDEPQDNVSLPRQFVIRQVLQW